MMPYTPCSMNSTQIVSHLKSESALRTTKNNKQAGPDGLMMELFKWMDFNNRTWILNLINHWWVHKCAPGDVFVAGVVSIFKRENTDLPENYRPISLLYYVYKIYMIMIRNRMQDILEEHLCDTQYGFRPSCSTSHAIYRNKKVPT